MSNFEKGTIDQEKEDYMRYCAASEKQLISEFVNDLKDSLIYQQPEDIELDDA